MNHPTYLIAGHVDKVLITTTLGSRGLEKKIVVYISPEVRKRNLSQICFKFFT